MAFRFKKRTFRPRRKFARRRFTRRRMSMRTSVPRSLRPSNVVTIQRNLTPGSIIMPLGTNTYAASYAPYVSQLQDWANWKATFDQYRIVRAVFYIRQINDTSSGTNLNSALPYGASRPDVYMTVDHDDSATPTSVSYMQQYDKMKQVILGSNRWAKYSFRPTPNEQLYQSAITTGYAVSSNRKWINCTTDTVPYYGLKMFIDYAAGYNGGTLVDPVYFETRFKLTVQLKNQR